MYAEVGLEGQAKKVNLASSVSIFQLSDAYGS